MVKRLLNLTITERIYVYYMYLIETKAVPFSICLADSNESSMYIYSQQLVYCRGRALNKCSYWISTRTDLEKHLLSHNSARGKSRSTCSYYCDSTSNWLLN